MDPGRILAILKSLLWLKFFDWKSLSIDPPCMWQGKDLLSTMDMTQILHWMAAAGGWPIISQWCIAWFYPQPKLDIVTLATDFDVCYPEPDFKNTSQRCRNYSFHLKITSKKELPFSMTFIFFELFCTFFQIPERKGIFCFHYYLWLSYQQSSIEDWSSVKVYSFLNECQNK